MEITFTVCTAADIDVLADVGKRSYLKSYPYIWKNEDTSFYIKRSFSETAFKKDFQDKELQYFLIHADKIPCGLFKIRKNSSVDVFTPGEGMELEKIYLLREYSDKGIGKKALQFILEHAKSNNKKALWLDVMDTSAALFFYQKIGFKTVSKYQLPYPGLLDNHRGMQRMVMEI